MATRTRATAGRPSAARTTVWIGAALGIGLMGALDTIVFHQFLQWHNFYVHTTDEWRIVSDGAIHTFTTTMLFIGAVWLWSRRQPVSRVATSRPFWAGILLGAGGFQLFDGVVNHLILQLHPVREGVDNPLPYDIAWNAAALLLLAAGWLLWRGADARAVAEPPPPTTERPALQPPRRRRSR